jgi:uncharacterized iron-regulated membrane protein
MKSNTLLRLVGLLTLLICVAGIPLYGQQAQQPATQEPTAQEPAAQQPATQEPTAQEPAAQQPATQEPTAQSPDSMSQESNQSQPTQMFMGKIAKSKGDLVLKGDAGTSYKLDNPDQAKQWVGKKVKVTGKLDTATNTIHVANIEAPSSGGPSY